jgi:hypothetical protein
MLIQYSEKLKSYPHKYMSDAIKMSTSTENLCDDFPLPDYVEEPPPKPINFTPIEIEGLIYEYVADMFIYDNGTTINDDVIHSFIKLAYLVIRKPYAQLFLKNNMHIVNTINSFANSISLQTDCLVGTISELRDILYEF